MKKYDYEYIGLYVDKSDIFYAVPTGANLKLDVNADIDILKILEPPYSDSDIENFVFETIGLCYTKENEDINAMHPLAKHFGVKTWKTATRNLKYINIDWVKDTGYSVNPSKKMKDGSYSGIDKKKILGHSPKLGEMASAVKEAIETSTII